MTARCYALVDANSFYCSCERIFRPDLATSPIVVLSNNDGCVVARTSEVKALGVPMGEPWFKLRGIARKHGIVAFSSNYTLYGELSSRFMRVLAQFVPPEDQEVYSIDESFLDFSHHALSDRTATGREIRARVHQWTGLPVCVGFGTTKTLAKLANHLAKKQGRWHGVCDLTVLDEAALYQLLDQVEVGNVWGVGRKIAATLQQGGVMTAGELRRCDARRIRERFNVVVERTVTELQGTACIAWEDQPPPRQQIIASRSFGTPLLTLEELVEPIHHHVGRAAAKLRRQGSVAGRIGVWIQTSPFRAQDPQYSPQQVIALPEPTDDTAILNAWAVALLRRMYRPGYRYAKAGVMLLELGDRRMAQGSLFDAAPPAEDLRRSRLMSVLDKANGKWGRGTIGIGSAGVRREGAWSMQRENLSPRYTTSWNELLAVS